MEVLDEERERCAAAIEKAVERAAERVRQGAEDSMKVSFQLPCWFLLPLFAKQSLYQLLNTVGVC